MNNKHPIYLLVIFCMALLSAGIVSAQENAPRALPDDLVINDSFEPDSSFWKVTNAVGDKVKCGDIGHADTDCAFMFKSGVGENTKIQQTYTPGLNASGTQSIYYTAHVRPFKAGMTIEFFVKVKFNNGAAALVKKFNYTSAMALASYEAVEMSTSLFNPGNVKKVIFGAVNKSTSGKAYIDGFFVGAFS